MCRSLQVSHFLYYSSKFIITWSLHPHGSNSGRVSHTFLLWPHHKHTMWWASWWVRLDGPCGSHSMCLSVCSWPQHYVAMCLPMCFSSPHTTWPMDGFSQTQFWSQEEGNGCFANLNLHTLCLFIFTFFLCHLLGWVLWWRPYKVPPKLQPPFPCSLHWQVAPLSLFLPYLQTPTQP